MNWSIAALLLLSLVLANLPFLTERLFCVWAFGSGGKNLAWRLLELVVMYFVAGAAAWVLESNMGPVHRQNWEFYAVTASMFLVLAYPGFVYRYLWRRRGQR
ncbi:MAG: DUF2818 family protein [Burkholderiales bacterium]|nr:DUF2818 family protein [Burkholderiales bacterium]